MKKSKKKPVVMTQSKINKLKHDIIGDSVDRALLLFLTAAFDEGVKEETLFRIVERANRYGDYVEDNLVSLHTMQELLEDKRGIKIKGF